MGLLWVSFGNEMSSCVLKGKRSSWALTPAGWALEPLLTHTWRSP